MKRPDWYFFYQLQYLSPDEAIKLAREREKG